MLEAAKAHAEAIKGAGDEAARETLAAAAADAHRLRDRVDALATPIAEGLTVLRSERDRLSGELRATYEAIGTDEQLRIPVFEGTIEEDEEEFSGVDATVVEDGEEAPEVERQEEIETEGHEEIEAQGAGGPAEAAEPAEGTEAAEAAEPAGQVPPVPEVRPLRRPARRDQTMAGIAVASSFLDLPSLDDAPEGPATGATPCEYCDGTGTCRSCHGRGRAGILRRCVSCSGTGRCLHCAGTGRPAAAS